MTTPYSTGPGSNGYPAQAPQQPAVSGRSRGNALGAACRGFGITGLVVFALVILGTLVYVLIPRGEHWLELAPIAFIFMAPFFCIPVVAVNIIGLVLGFAALKQTKNRIDTVLRLLERSEAENQTDDVHRDDGDTEEWGHEDESDRSQFQPVLTPRNQHVHQRPEDDEREDNESGDPKSATRCP